MAVARVVEKIDAVFIREREGVGRPQPRGPSRAVNKDEWLCVRRTETSLFNKVLRVVGGEVKVWRREVAG